jgi:tetratricopeptide (TPR) repeat protein
MEELISALDEAILSEQPDDVNTRFEHAYAVSNASDAELALFHYQAIPENARSGVAWNNLGVAARDKELHGLSVEAFEEGAAAGIPLSRANLAVAYQTAGFLKRANELAKEALAADEVSAYANSVMARIIQQPKEEELALETIRRRARRKSEYLAGFGKAITKPLPPNFCKNWQGGTFATFTIEVYESSVTGQASRQAAVGLGAAVGGDRPPDPVTYRISGTVLGSAMSLTISRIGTKASNTLLGSLMEQEESLVYLNEAGTRLEFALNPSSAEPSFASATETR